MQCFPPVRLSYNISSERRFTVCVGTHTLNIFLKNFPTGRKNLCMGTISQMAKAIVPYIKGLVKSRHSQTSSNISLTLVFWNTLNLEVMVLTPLEFACGVSFIADA